MVCGSKMALKDYEFSYYVNYDEIEIDGELVTWIRREMKNMHQFRTVILALMMQSYRMVLV